jgi:hypothetical protein
MAFMSRKHIIEIRIPASYLSRYASVEYIVSIFPFCSLPCNSKLLYAFDICIKNREYFWEFSQQTMHHVFHLKI